MLYLELNEIVQGDKREKIKDWGVWFMTPMGITPNKDQAIKVCESLEIPAYLNIVPIPVAIGDSTYEVVWSR